MHVVSSARRTGLGPSFFWMRWQDVGMGKNLHCHPQLRLCFAPDWILHWENIW